MTTRLATCSSLAALAAVGFAAASSGARPRTKIVPPPASQLQPQQPNQGTIPTQLAGQQLNLTPTQAATLAAWQQRVRQATDGRLGGYTGPRIDGSMGEKNVTSYAIPMKNGTVTGVLTLPTDAQIGVWLGGPATAVYDTNAKPAGSGTLVDQIAPVSKNALDALPQIKPVPMTDAALADAMQKYPKSDGWTTLWLGDKGKLFVKGDPCDLHTISDAFSKLDKPTDGPDLRSNLSVTDYGHAMQGALDNTCAHHRPVVQGPDAPMPLPKSALAPDEPAPSKFTLSGYDLAAQAAAIRQTMSVADDDGRLERSLALTEAAQPLWRAEGLKRLANVYLANPNLVKAPVEADFDGVDATVLRSLVVQAVNEAQRGSDGKAWVAVAVLMAAQHRPDQALAMLPKASKTITDDATLDKIDELAAVLRNMKAKP